MKKLTANYWNNRYEEDNTPWNIGHISPPLKNFIDSIEDKTIRILIPGAGHAHEAVYLNNLGFDNVFVCDWAKDSFKNLRTNAPNFPEDNLLACDFFTLAIEVDLILEQTFFCAINPVLRKEYAKKVSELLAPEGRLVGLLFSQPFERQGPPFGGTAEEYVGYFSPYFEIKKMDNCVASIEPRLGNELFIELLKR